MRDGTRLGLLALAVAALLGLLGDLLLRAIPWGVNAPLWILALIVGAGALVRQARRPPLGEGRWLALAALGFAAGVALRDSTALVAVNLLAVLLTLALAAHRVEASWPRIGGLPEYLTALVSAGLHVCGGVLALALYDVRWREVPRTGWSATLLAVVRGLAIAVPLLFVFGGLFMAADAVFSGLVTNLLAIEVRELFGHLLLTGIWFWLVAGFLRQALFCTVALPKRTPNAPAPGDVADAPESAGEAATHAPPRRTGGRIGVLGLVELGIVLGLLDLLFLAFVVVQFRYLFGGADLVQVSESLTYAEYARRGFFELVWVAALLLPTVLLLDWLGRLDRPRDVAVYRALAGLLVVLLFVVIVSALQRMRLYTVEYGLTELRLYTTAFMLWITGSVCWYVATVLRDQRERFLFGVLVAGLTVAGALNAVNPDELIVRTNAARADAAARFDGAYTLTLSADAAPALIEALPHIPEYQRAMVARRLLWRWETGQSEDWRSWNYGRWRAAQAAAANEAMLRSAANLPPSSKPVRSSGGRTLGGPRFDVPEPGRRP